MAKSSGKRFCFVYRTTNLRNGKYYIGCHCTFKLDDGYLGSGMRLKRSIAKYGLASFQLEILQFFETREEALAREKELVTEELLKDPMCMNLIEGGGPFDQAAQLRGAKARAKKTWSDPEFRKRHSIAQSIRMKRLNEQGKIRYATRTGMRNSEESRRKQSLSMRGKQSGSRNSQSGTRWMSHIEHGTKKVRTEEIQEHLNSGWLLKRTNMSWLKRK